MLFAVADQPYSQVKLSFMGRIKYILRVTFPSLNKHLPSYLPSKKIYLSQSAGQEFFLTLQYHTIISNIMMVKKDQEVID